MPQSRRVWFRLILFLCGGPIAQSRLERTPDKREVVGSIPTRPTTLSRGCSSDGRAPALQAGGHRFESVHLHQFFDNRIGLDRGYSYFGIKLLRAYGGCLGVGRR